MRRLPLALVLLLLAASAVAAQVYKWTDSNGTVHYSQTPPPQGTPFKRLTTAGSEQPAPPPPTREADGEPADSEPADEPTAAAPIEDTPENRAKLCDSLKANLDLLKGKQAVVMEQGGKQIALDDKQRGEQIAVAERQYQQFCSQ